MRVTVMRIPQVKVYLWAVAIVVALSGGALLSWTSDASAADDVPVCHSSVKNASWERLPIGPISAAKHTSLHPEDAMPGDDVPGVAGMVFDADCNVVESSSCISYSGPYTGLGMCQTDAVAVCYTNDSEFAACVDAGGKTDGTDCQAGGFLPTYTCSCSTC